MNLFFKNLFGCLLLLLISSTVEAGTYRFYIQNETFVKNLERGRGEAPPGAAAETFIGNILKPFIRFKISKEMKVDLGALLQVPFGDDDRVDQADPVVSFHYDFYPGYRFTAGTLDHIHPILDALFNDDLEFTDPVEQGFQLQARKKHFRQDIWFDWRERELSTRRENVAAGNFTQFKNKGLMVELQAYYFHFGGGVNSIKTVHDNYSFALGTGYSFRPRKRKRTSGIFGESGFTVHYLMSFNQITRSSPTTDEDGVLWKLFTHLWGAKVYLLQWDGGGPNFIPSRGDPFYQANSFTEMGIEKTWWFKKNVALRTNVRVTRLSGNTFVEHLLSLKWRINFTSDKKNKTSNRRRKLR